MHYRTNPSTGLRARLLGATAMAALAASFNVAAPNEAGAAGFALKEQSAAAQGNAFAGATAGAEDVTYMFFNPAGLTRHEGTQATAVVSYIVPSADLQSASGRDMAGNPITGTATGDAGSGAAVPAAYLLWSVSPDLKLGLGINAPFGLATDYASTWVGKYHALKSELMTVNINPAIAYRVNERVSIGVGLQAQYLDVTLSQAIDFNSISSGAVPADGSAEISGDAWGYGFNLGILIEVSDATRIGAAYRSKIAHDIEGTADFTIPFGVTPAAFSGAFADTVATADFTSPDTASVGIHHDVSEQLSIMAEAAWTGWSSFDELRINYANPVQPDSVTTENWDDSWFFGIGATWRASEQLAIRGGVAYDQTPIPDAYRTPRIPGNDRTWVSVGLNYAVSPGFTIDAGYTHIFVDDSTVNLNNAAPLELDAAYENSVDIIALQATVKF